MPDTNTKPERVLWLDLLRITAIFAMVLLHVCAGNFAGNDSAWRTSPPDTLSWQALNVYNCLVRFCVPVFCMISGVFFLDPKREQPLSALFSKNIRRLALAFISASVVYAAVGPVLRGEPLTSLGTLLGAVKNAAFGHYHLWFLLMLIGFYLIVPLLHGICADRRKTEYFLLLTFVFTFLQNTLLLLPTLANAVAIQAGKMSLYLVTGYVGYFVLGSYLYRFPLDKTARRWIYAGGAVSFVGTAAVTGVFSAVTGQAHDALYGYLLPNTLLEATAVFLLFQQLSGRRFSARAQRVIPALSRCTFGVYLVHDLFLMLLRRLGVTALSFSPVASVPILTVAVCACSLAVSYLLRRIPPLRRYIL